VQIIPPASVGYWALSFTPDGNYINFVRIGANDPLAALYQMPVLGGAQKKLLSDMDGAVSYSPDGKQFAFVRGNNPNIGESALMIANADGTGERILAVHKKPQTFPWWTRQTPAWSPDGKTIACIIGGVFSGSGPMNVVVVDVADGTIKPVTTQGWYEIKRVAWLKDKSGLLILAADKAISYYTQQIWHITYPDGKARRITTDFNNYVGLSLAADSDALTAVQSNRISNIWIAPNADASRAAQIKSGGNNDEGTDGLSLTPDGRIVYYSRASGADDIWIMNGDGTNQKQLTVDTGANYDLKVTPAGRYIVFTSERTGAMNLWRMDLDGGNPKQLTNGNSDLGAAISPDSQSVIYNSDSSGRPAIWKVSIDGGNAVKLTEYAAENPEVSPDGKLIVCQYREEINSPWKYAIIPIDGGKPIKVFDLPSAPEKDIRWSPDGRALTYVTHQNGVSNIWSYPLDGSQPKQLTDFKTDHIYNFKWSPDGKNLVLARGTTTSDVVLIRDFR
jgi:Tol biopolymer transport system component